jgi:hypothetical protein
VKTLSKLDKSLHERAEAVDLSKEGKTSLVLVLLILNDVVEQLAEITKLADPHLNLSTGIDENKAPDITLGGGPRALGGYNRVNRRRSGD